MRRFECLWQIRAVFGGWHIMPPAQYLGWRINIAEQMYLDLCAVELVSWFEGPTIGP
jgi:hypothetical protein